MNESRPDLSETNLMDRPMRSDDESILVELLDHWETAWQRGEVLTPEQLCADHPQLIDQLRWKIEALQAINVQMCTRSLGAARQVVGLPLEESMRATANYAAFEYLAEGGLGVVFTATDRSLNREVAVKFIQPRLTNDLVSRRQFDIEAEVTGRLEHPGVVPLYAIGQTSQGKPFYVMRYIQGETLDARIEQFHDQGSQPGIERFASLDFRELLQHFVAVCNTIAYAHNRGILHRDIKPANVMLGRYGETLVVDWGLAIPIDRDARAKASGEVSLLPSSGSQSGATSGGGAGTLAYMSPEQSLDDAPLAATSDVYSLGATLYKMLTGRAPYTGKDLRQTLKSLRNGDFPPPRQLNRHVPRPLQAICLHAMAINPGDRYPTALDLAHDIERFLADDPVSVRPDTMLHRCGRWFRRHRAAARALAIVTLAMLITSMIAAVGFQRLAQHEHESLLASKAAQGRGLQMAARFAARTVAGELDVRWRILEVEAGDSELRALLAEAGTLQSDPQRSRRIQAWLDSRFLEHRSAAGYASWFICDAQGSQIARSPRADTIGRNFAYRDYFHGQTEGDRAPGDNAQLEPLRSAHLSQAFESQATGDDMVAFSVPVWNGNVDSINRHVIGVLAMTVHTGDFGILESGLHSDQVAMLVDTRIDRIERQPLTGRILHHPQLSSLRASDTESSQRLTEELVAELVDLRRLRLNRGDGTSRDDDNSLTPLRPFTDPLDPEAQEPGLAAFEPVIIRGRNLPTRDTGWIVIVQTPATD